MSNMLDMELLQTFVAISETGGFTRAAEQVHRSSRARGEAVDYLARMVRESLAETATIAAQRESR